MTPKSKRLLIGAGAGMSAVLLFLAAIPAGLIRPPIEVLMLPALPLLPLGLNSILFRPDMPDDEGFARLFVLLVIAWPLLGAAGGALVAYLWGLRNQNTKPNA
ncbi:MAG: hypothetical protein WC551_03175 [Patescibacteria group bacterium]